MRYVHRAVSKPHAVRVVFRKFEGDRVVFLDLKRTGNHTRSVWFLKNLGFACGFRIKIEIFKNKNKLK